MLHQPDETYRDCPWCGLRDSHMEVLLADRPVNSRGGVREWAVVACHRCAGAVLIETAHGRMEVVQVLPDSSMHVTVAHLPEPVEKHFATAVRLLAAGESDPAAVQLRRTLEGAAHHAGVDTGSLVQRIEKLIEKGMITAPFGEALHHVRKLGNIGAHYSDEHLTDEQTRQALSFTTQLLRNMYEIPAELALIRGDDPEAAS